MPTVLENHLPSPGAGQHQEDTPQDLGLIYRQMGVKGLEGIENVGPSLARVVETLIRQWA